MLFNNRGVGSFPSLVAPPPGNNREGSGVAYSVPPGGGASEGVSIMSI